LLKTVKPQPIKTFSYQSFAKTSIKDSKSGYLNARMNEDKSLNKNFFRKKSFEKVNVRKRLV